MARARIETFVGLNTTAFRRGLRAMRRRWRSFRSAVVGPMMRFGRMVGRAFMRAGIAIGASLVFAVREGSRFRQEMAKVSTMVQGNQDVMAEFSEELLKMAGRFGQAKSTLAKGLFDILSAGIPAGKALQFLEVATRAAIGGATDAATSVDALTTVVNAYGLAADTAGTVSDILFQVVKEGKIEYEELAEQIGKIAPTAKVAGVNLRDLGATIATLVRVEKPERAMTALRAAMIKAAEGGETLFQLVERFKGKSLTDIVQAGISRRAAQGVAILAANFGMLRSELAKFQNVAGAAEDAFQKMDKVRHWQKLWGKLLSIVTRVGQALDKALAPAVELLRNQLNRLVDTPGFKAFIAQVESVTRTLVGAVTALARGGQARQLALKGFKLIIVGAFRAGAQKAIDLLTKVAPVIGKLIAAGFTAIVESPAKEAGRRSVARGIVAARISRETRGELGEREIKFGMTAFGAFGNEIEAEVERLKRLDLAATIDKISKDLDVAITSTGDPLKDGFALLDEAARKATEDLAEFQAALQKPTAPGAPLPAEAGGGGAGPARDFSELRRIGANILMGAAGTDRTQRTRLQMLREQAATAKAVRELEETAREELEVQKQIARNTGGPAKF